MNATRETWRRMVLSARHPAHHIPVWEWLLDREHIYPARLDVPPWKRSRKSERARPVTMAELRCATFADSLYPKPVSIALTSLDDQVTIDVSASSDGAADIAEALLTPSQSGTYYVFADGGANAFGPIMEWWLPTFVDLGYRVQPVASKIHMIMIRITKGRHSWYLIDWHSISGMSMSELITWHETNGTTSSELSNPLTLALRHLTQVQEVLIARFGTALRPTVAGTAMAAMRWILPREVKVFRPHPTLVALCRDGVGYRGGYMYARKYRGNAWAVDFRRLYLHCMTYPTAEHWSFSQYLPDDARNEGIYVCDVSGVPPIPVYLGVWNGTTDGFKREHWYGGETIAVIPTTEFAGLRAMGLTITPAFGYRITRTFDVSEFVTTIADILSRIPSRSPLAAYIKIMGNGISGKWASNPVNRGILYARERPPEATFPALDERGNEIPDCWWYEQTRYSGTQQIGLAAMITGLARSRLYESLARIIAEGMEPIHVHTDGIIVKGSAPLWATQLQDRIGELRYEGQDTDAIVIAPGRYIFADKLKRSGASGGTRQTLVNQMG